MRKTSAKRAVAALLLLVLVVAFVGKNISAKPGVAHAEAWRSGDVVFFEGTSLRSRIVRLLQGYGSDYSHVGIVVVGGDGAPSVVHADPAKGKVVRQCWDEILASGEFSGGALYRVQATDEFSTGPACEFAERRAIDGTPFDGEFDSKTADALYCTELVWRAYDAAGVDLAGGTAEGDYILPAKLAASPRLRKVLQF